MNVAFQFNPENLKEAEFSRIKPSTINREVVGTCGKCRSLALLYFNGNYLKGMLPEVPKPRCPAHMPPNVEKAYMEAENALLAHLFPSAASQYRKAIDRAVSPLVEVKFKSKMLGHKLSNLEKTGIIPTPMIEWIRLVKDDANYALHDDDKDFESAEEVEPMRTFAHTLLTYLYTMPKQVELARDTIASRESE